jgi:predicted dehydrogenase
MVGHGFMGATHSLAWRNAPGVFGLPVGVELAVVVGTDPVRTAAAARRWGWAESGTDWRGLVGSDEIDVVDICSPGDTHAQVALGALAAGKHVLCEKPLGNSVAEAEAMTAAASEAAGRGVVSMVGFNYRRVPAVALARDMVAAGRLGRVRHVRACYLQDWLVDPDFPLTWRLRRDRAGSGALGDLGAHVVDLVRCVTGEELVGVCALSETFVAERPLPDPGGPAEGLTGRGGAERGRVDVDDAVVAIARLDGGGLVTLEATSMAPGRKNALRFELNGSEGSVAFDFEAMNELWVSGAGGEGNGAGGFNRVLVTEADHPYLEGWWPPGHGLGYDHTFVNQARDFIDAVCSGVAPAPSFADGLVVQRVLDAVERSAARGAAWTSCGGNVPAGGPLSTSEETR